MPLPVVRQRKPHHKTRAGCITCRSRHIKCGEEKPGCQNCKNRNLPCGGYQKPKAKIFDSRLAPAPRSSGSGGEDLDRLSPRDEANMAPSTDSNSEQQEQSFAGSLPYRTAGSNEARVGCATCRKRRMKCDLQYSSFPPAGTTPNCKRCTKANLLCEAPGSPSTASNTTTPMLSSVTDVDPSFILCSSDVDHDFLVESNSPWHLFLNQIDTYCAGTSLHSALTSSFSTCPPAVNFYHLWTDSWTASSDNMSISDLDHFDPSIVPLPGFHMDYASLRHIYTATAFHHLALEIPTLTIPTLNHLQTLALDHETRAIQALRTEAPPPAVTALTAFLFFWVEVWQRGWDAAIPHLRYAQSTVRPCGTVGGSAAMTREVVDFIETFCRGIPSVLQRGETLVTLPEAEKEDEPSPVEMMAAASASLSSSSSVVSSPGLLDDFSTSLSSALPFKPRTSGQGEFSPATACTNLRLVYATFHAQRAIVWADGAAQEAQRLTKPHHHRDSAQTSRYVQSLLAVLGAELQALLDRWGAAAAAAQSEPATTPLSALESPFAAAMKHLGLFLGRKAGFEVALFEAQVKLSVRCLLLFAAGKDAKLRMDVVGVLRRGGEVRRQLVGEEDEQGGLGTSLSMGLGLGMQTQAQAGPQAGFGVGVLDPQLALDMQPVADGGGGKDAGAGGSGVLAGL